MSTYYQDEHVTLYRGDCLEQLAALPDASVDAVVTDPPYGLSNTTPAQVAETITRWVSGDREYLPSARGFMGHEWDGFVPPVAVWDECLRVLKPGGHLLAFAGSRTQDLMGLAVRLAGFEIRDSVAWLYGSGFPKSLDVSKAIDKGAGATPIGTGDFKRASIQRNGAGDNWIKGAFGSHPEETKRVEITAPATDAAQQWQGWGTALKPAHEPIILARKPLTGTVAANVLEHGTGALNIDGCRINPGTPVPGGSGNRDSYRELEGRSDRMEHGGNPAHTPGRWPANVVLDESQAEVLDEQTGHLGSAKTVNSNRAHGELNGNEVYGAMRQLNRPDHTYGDSGGASRFFHVARVDVDLGDSSRFMYVAKAPKSERPVVDGTAHPTVKPLALMGWLVRMVTPPGGTVLDPFAGSGTTLEAAVREGFNCIGIERQDEYLPLIHHRIQRARLELLDTALEELL